VWDQDRKIGIALFGLFIVCWTTAFVLLGFSIQRLTVKGGKHSDIHTIIYAPATGRTHPSI
jgi:hypothetical protein